MNYLAFEPDVDHAKLRREIDAAARRERATTLKRFLAQSAQALLGRRSSTSPEQICAAC